MNERIENLVLQVTGGGRLEGYMLREEYLVFAQLIVRDCINISTKVDKNPYVPDHDQAKKIIREIKQHFGVE